MYEIYLITNEVNGKIYVGQTSHGFMVRMKQHISDARGGSTLSLHQAMRKYGQDNFTISLLESTHICEELNDLERFWIKKLRAKDSKVGYNRTDGGDGFAGLSEESKEKHRVAHQGTRANKYRHDVTSENVAKLYQEGKTCREIMEILRVGKNTVLNRLKKSGVPARPPGERTILENTPRYRSDVSTEDMVNLFQKGLSHQSIGEKLGVTCGCVAERLKKLGIFRSRLCNLDPELVTELYLFGFSSKDIAEKFGVSPASICNLLEKQGVPRRKGKSDPRLSARKEKKCSICRVAQPLVSFGKNRSSVDGHDYVCRSCRKEQRKRVTELSESPLPSSTDAERLGLLVSLPALNPSQLCGYISSEPVLEAVEELSAR